jgi:hypothetical protein
MLPIVVHFSVDGSYNSALFRLPPPVTNTFPFVNVDAVCPIRATFMLPVVLHSTQVKHSSEKNIFSFYQL